MDRPLWQLLLELKTAVLRQRPFTCDECFLLLEYLAESLVKEMPPAEEKKLREALRQHIEACPNCQAYYLARLEALEAQLEAQTEEKK